MSAVTGTGHLLRLSLRRDRWRIPAWVAALVGLAVLRVANVVTLHQTQDSLDEFAQIARSSPAAAALNGLPTALDTIGGRVAFEIHVTFAVALGLMSLLAVTRHTRTEELAGRTELVRAGTVGRHAQPAAAVLLATATNVAIAVLTTIVLTSFDLPTIGSVVLAGSAAMVGIVFAAVAGVAAQLTTRPRAASGLAGGLLGAAFALRAIGDTSAGWLSWWSPIGWAQAAQPYGHDRWWPIALGLAVAAAATALAARMAGHRDVGGAAFTLRPGPASAAPGLSSPIGLARRLHRGATTAWLLGITAYGSVFGLVGREIEEIAATSPAVAEFLSDGDGAVVESYLATVAVMLALITAGYVTQGLLRMHAEEAVGRVELVLARPVSRQQWATSHVALVTAGSVAILSTSGATVGLLHGVRVGQLSWAATMTAATLAQLPAVWLLAGLVLALYGLSPRLATMSWVGLGGVVVITFLTELTHLPTWLHDLSPFTHLPRLPAAEFTLTSPALLVAVAGSLATVGVLGIRRRDIRT